MSKCAQQVNCCKLKDLNKFLMPYVFLYLLQLLTWIYFEKKIKKLLWGLVFDNILTLVKKRLIFLLVILEFFLDLNNSIVKATFPQNKGRGVFWDFFIPYASQNPLKIKTCLAKWCKLRFTILIIMFLRYIDLILQFLKYFEN